MQQPVLHISFALCPIAVTAQVSGIGKYTFLSLKDSDLRFGDVLVGEQVQQSVQLLNQGMVPADFAIMPAHTSANALPTQTIRVTPSRSAAGLALSFLCINPFAVQQGHTISLRWLYICTMDYLL